MEQQRGGTTVPGSWKMPGKNGNMFCSKPIKLKYFSLDLESGRSFTCLGVPALKRVFRFQHNKLSLT